MQLAQDGWSTVSDYVYKRRGGSGGGGSFEDGYHLPILVELVKNNWNSLVDWVSGKKTAVETAVSLAQKDWTTVKEWVKERFGDKIEAVITLVKKAGQSLAGLIGDKLGAVVTFAKKSGQSLKGLIGDATSAVVTFAKKKGQSLGGLIGTGLKATINLVKGWKGTVVKALGLDKLSAKFQIKLPKVTITWSNGKIPLPSFHLKWNARGAILDGATLFGMAGNTLLGGGEAGREAVLPLDNNTGWMDQLADRLAQRMGGSGSNQPIVVQVTLDGRVVAESTVRELHGMTREGRDPLAGLV